MPETPSMSPMTRTFTPAGPRARPSAASDTHCPRRNVASPETIFCPNCGERISARARFCPSCGARQADFAVAAPEPGGLWSARPADEPPAAPAPEDDAPPPTERESFGELTGLLAERLALPGMVAAALAALMAAGAVLAAGLILAVITPDGSILGVMGQDAGLLTEAFRQAIGTLLAPVVDAGPLLTGSGRLDPLLLLAVPLGAVALATRAQLHRTEGAAPLARLGSATVVAVPFALLMLAFAILGGSTTSTGVSPSAGAAFGLGLLWGVAGALIGAATRLPLRVPRHRALAVAAATLRPLAAVVAACTAIGLAGWLVQVARGVDDVRIGRGAPTALIEEAAFAGEHGIHLTALAAGARFRVDTTGAMGLPFPVDRPGDVPGADGGLRIFSYHAALPASVLLPALVVLLGLVTLGALYAGFAAARAAEARSLQAGVAWGAIAGAVWAIAMAILNALAGGSFHGAAEGGSVFVAFLLGGAILGAAGGALADTGAAPAPDA